DSLARATCVVRRSQGRDRKSGEAGRHCIRTGADPGAESGPFAVFVQLQTATRGARTNPHAWREPKPLKGPDSAPASAPVRMQNPDLLPYSFNFKPPPAARELTLTLGVSRSRFAEFLAKPEQVREDAVVPKD